MENLPEVVREIFRYATSEEKRFLKGVPSLIEIEKGINNFNMFSEGERSIAKRIKMGEIGLDKKVVAGYHSFTIMNNANATPYERDFINMGSGMNYVYLKKLFVHPKYRNKGIGTKLITNALNLARELDKHSIADVERNNYLMANILTQQEFQNDFEWSTPRGVSMIRFYHD